MFFRYLLVGLHYLSRVQEYTHAWDLMGTWSRESDGIPQQGLIYLAIIWDMSIFHESYDVL